MFNDAAALSALTPLKCCMMAALHIWGFWKCSGAFEHIVVPYQDTVQQELACNSGCIVLGCLRGVQLASAGSPGDGKGL
jgi:hypothetical protein